MKYLNDFFVPYDSLLETSTLLTSMLSIEITFIDLFIVRIYALSIHSYTMRKKKGKMFL